MFRTDSSSCLLNKELHTGVIYSKQQSKAVIGTSKSRAPFWHHTDPSPRTTVPKIFTSYDQGSFMAGLTSLIWNLTVVVFKVQPVLCSR